MSFQHVLKIAEGESALARMQGELCGKCRVVQDFGDFVCQRGSIAHGKREACIADDLDERAQAGCDDRQTTQHIFGNDQAEDFTGEGRHNDGGGSAESPSELIAKEPARETHAPGERRLLSELFKSCAFRTVADEEQFEFLVVFAQEPRSVKEYAHAFGRHQAAQERYNWRLSRGSPNRRNRRGGFETVGNGNYSRELNKPAKPGGRDDVMSNATANEAADKRQHPELQGSDPALTGIAAQAYGVMAGHEVARTRSTGGFEHQLPIGTNGLETVMFDNYFLAREQTKNHGDKRRTSDVNNVGAANETEQLEEARIADDCKGQRAIIELFRRSWCDQGDCKFGSTTGIAEAGEPTSQRLHQGLQAADAGREGVAVKEQLQTKEPSESGAANFTPSTVRAGQTSDAQRSKPARLDDCTFSAARLTVLDAASAC